MRSLTAEVKTEKNSPTNKPIFLYEVFDYDGATHLYYAEYDANVTFDSQTYTAIPIKHDFVGENTQGEIDMVRITIGNANRVLQSYLELYDLRKLKVKITIVWANRLNDPTAKIEDIFYIDSYTATEQAVEFVLSSKFDVLDVKLPFSKYFRNSCRFVFKGAECQYAGAETTCDRTLQRCKVLVNSLHYGGFPSIPTKKLYVS
jgi:lambda family phage minor tail protein L